MGVVVGLDWVVGVGVVVVRVVVRRKGRSIKIGIVVGVVNSSNRTGKRVVVVVVVG
jgi:hypothetical protein